MVGRNCPRKGLTGFYGIMLYPKGWEGRHGAHSAWKPRDGTLQLSLRNWGLIPSG